jgi:hypothetical protein
VPFTLTVVGRCHRFHCSHRPSRIKTNYTRATVVGLAPHEPPRCLLLQERSDGTEIA